jgi:MFS family permease
MDVIGEVVRSTIVQLRTPDELRGRVTALTIIFTNGGPQLGQLQGGAIATAFGPVEAAFFGGLGVLLSTAVFAFNPHLRRPPKEPGPIPGTLPERRAATVGGIAGLVLAFLLIRRRRRRKRTAAERVRESIETVLAEAETRAKDLRKQATKIKGEARQRLQEQAKDIEARQKERRVRLEELGAEARRVVATARP